MIVVSDTTPLISLMKADSLPLLAPLFGEVLLPEAVYAELTSNPRFAEEAKQISSCAFLRVVTLNEPRAVDILRRANGLDLGESEAIVYADGVKADVLLMDEAKGRAVAKSMGLRIMGTIGVLLFAYEEMLLSVDRTRRALETLKLANRHISDDLFSYALSKLESQSF